MIAIHRRLSIFLESNLLQPVRLTLNFLPHVLSVLLQFASEGVVAGRQNPSSKQRSVDLRHISGISQNSKKEHTELLIATVATGTPLGICTMLKRLSIPSNVLPLTGTPITGSGVLAAIMPGRWAAPPAAAMMTLKPFAAADSAKSSILRGVRCADVMVTW